MKPKMRPAYQHGLMTGLDKLLMLPSVFWKTALFLLSLATVMTPMLIKQGVFAMPPAEMGIAILLSAVVTSLVILGLYALCQQVFGRWLLTMPLLLTQLGINHGRETAPSAMQTRLIGGVLTFVLMMVAVHPSIGHAAHIGVLHVFVSVGLTISAVYGCLKGLCSLSLASTGTQPPDSTHHP